MLARGRFYHSACCTRGRRQFDCMGFMDQQWQNALLLRPGNRCYYSLFRIIVTDSTKHVLVPGSFGIAGYPYEITQDR